MIPTLRPPTCFVLIALALSGCVRPVILNAGNAPANGLTASGEGEAKAAPDIARTNIGVEIRAENVEQANAEAGKRMRALIVAIEQLGIAEKDLRTHSLSISFETVPVAPMSPPDAPVPPAPRGYYRVSNMLEVTIRDLDRAGRVLQVATDAGANSVWGISFELEDPKPLMERARSEAVANAKKNAAALAQLAGVELGSIVSISENTGGIAPRPMFALKAADSGGGMPVERGEITVSHQVQLVYSLRER